MLLDGESFVGGVKVSLTKEEKFDGRREEGG
jgi:hypothetical protein